MISFLLQKLHGGGEFVNVYAEIYDKYGDLVYGYALKLCGNETVAEDLTQSTFLKAIENMKSFRGQSSISTWLCSITKNLYLNMLKKKESQNVSLEIVVEQVGEGFEELLLNKENCRRIHKILHELQEPYKEVFSLRIFGEMSFKDIGDLFGKSDLWARVTYRRAREKIVLQFQRQEKGGR